VRILPLVLFQRDLPRRSLGIVVDLGRVVTLCVPGLLAEGKEIGVDGSGEY
jgi:hypothetical protein